MRVMQRGRESLNVSLNVLEHIILVNGWEYYISEKPENDLWFGLVCGAETELGYILFEEIEPYILSRTTDLNDVFPAPKWEWVD